MDEDEGQVTALARQRNKFGRRRNNVVPPTEGRRARAGEEALCGELYASIREVAGEKAKGARHHQHLPSPVHRRAPALKMFVRSHALPIHQNHALGACAQTV